MRFKTFSGSFSRYWNEILKVFFFDFFCQNMLKNEISIQNLKNIQNISCLTSTWVSNSLKGHPLVCNLGLQSFKGTYLATVLQSWFIGVRFFKAEICPGSHSLRGYQWSLKDSGVRVGGRIARGIYIVNGKFRDLIRNFCGLCMLMHAYVFSIFFNSVCHTGRDTFCGPKSRNQSLQRCLRA